MSQRRSDKQHCNVERNVSYGVYTNTPTSPQNRCKACAGYLYTDCVRADVQAQIAYILWHTQQQPSEAHEPTNSLLQATCQLKRSPCWLPDTNASKQTHPPSSQVLQVCFKCLSLRLQINKLAQAALQLSEGLLYFR